MTNQAQSSAKHNLIANAIRYLTKHTAIQDQSLGEAFPQVDTVEFVFHQ